MSREQKDVDGLPVVGQAKIWSKSKLIEDIKVNQHAILKTDFDRDYPGELNEFDVILAKDVAQLIQDKIDDLGDKISRKEYLSDDEPEKEAVRVLGKLLDEVDA